MENNIEDAVLKWVGVDSFVRRLLLLAKELHGSQDEAHEIFCYLQDEQYFKMKLAADMPHGSAAKYYRCVSMSELILERVRLAPRLFVKHASLGEYVLRDCITSLRQLQPARELFDEKGSLNICEIYGALAQSLRVGKYDDKGELWDELARACEDLQDPEMQASCRASIKL